MQSKMGFKLVGVKPRNGGWRGHILQRPQSDSVLYGMYITGNGGGETQEMLQRYLRYTIMLGLWYLNRN